MCALDHPAMPTQGLMAVDTAAGDARGDPSLAQMLAAAREVIALVGVQLVGPPTWPTGQSGNCWQRIDQRFESHRVMPVGTGHGQGQGTPRRRRGPPCQRAALLSCAPDP